MRNYKFLLDLILKIETLKNMDITRIQGEDDQIIRKMAWAEVLYEENPIDDSEVNPLKAFVSQYVDKQLERLGFTSEKAALKRKFFLLLRCRDALLKINNAATWYGISTTLVTGNGILSLYFNSNTFANNRVIIYETDIINVLDEVCHVIDEFKLTGLWLHSQRNFSSIKVFYQVLCDMIKLPNLSVLYISDGELTKINKLIGQPFCNALSQSYITRLIIKGKDLDTCYLQQLNQIIESNIRRQQIQQQRGLFKLAARSIWWHSKKRKRLPGESCQDQRCLKRQASASKSNTSMFSCDEKDNTISGTKVPPEVFPEISANILEGCQLSR